MDGNIERIGAGTGFFYRIGATTHLITNWHVVTGRHPEDPAKLLPGFPISPTHFQLHIPKRSNQNWFIPGELVPLYENGRAIWLETPLRNAVDLVAIPYEFPRTAIVPAIQDFAPYDDLILVPGVDVVVVGFPFGRNETNPFPIWKRAMISSEPAYTVNGRPFAYLDTPGRPGMSGSPVYAIGEGFEVTHEEKAVLGSDASPLTKIMSLGNLKGRSKLPTLEFVGVYSGSYGDQQLDRLNLGRFWPAGLIGGYEDKFVAGSNPNPPLYD